MYSLSPASPHITLQFWVCRTDISDGLGAPFYPDFIDCHIYGVIVVILSGMFFGGRFHALNQFDLDRFCQKMIDIEATDMHIVPPVALLLALSPAAQKYDIKSMQRIVIAAAPLKAELQMKLKARFLQANVSQGLYTELDAYTFLPSFRTFGKNCFSSGANCAMKRIWSYRVLSLRLPSTRK
jgi:hypothetical protein